MAEITEAQARRICEAVRLGSGDGWEYLPAEDWPDLAPVALPFDPRRYARVPLWRIVQRAAAEGGSRDDA